MSTGALWLTSLAMVVGLVGIVVPILPGILLVWAAVLVWAIVEGSATGWVIFGIATVVTAVSQVMKYVIPGRRLRDLGVPMRTTVIGGIAGIVGFFLIPVVGLVIGFVGGVYVAERARLGTHTAAWTSTLHALKAAGLSILIELAAGLVVVAFWLGAVVFG